MLHNPRSRRLTIARVHRALAAVLAAIVTFGIFTLTGAPANALAQPQTTSRGTIVYLMGEMDHFWAANFRNWGLARRYVHPKIYLYRGEIRACGGVLPPNNAFSCGGRIYIDSRWSQRKLNKYGDYAPGVVLAHEWGHEIQWMLGWKSASGTLGEELFADCLAGMYTRYGLTVTGRLDNSDYWEGYSMAASSAGGDHGTAKQRTAWYRYGYKSYNINACGRALR